MKQQYTQNLKQEDAWYVQEKTRRPVYLEWKDRGVKVE